MGIWKISENDRSIDDGEMSYDYPLADSVPGMESLGMFTNTAKRIAHSSKIRSLALNQNLGVSHPVSSIEYIYITCMGVLYVLYTYVYMYI